MDAMHVQRCAAQLRALADEVRAAAARVAAEQAVEWKSLAANRFRAVLEREARWGRQCAELLDDAAHAFAAHARALGAPPAEGSR